MKKAPLFILILVFLVFSLAGIAHSWQGRMAGMGDPYGLIKDESDFLIHPAGIAKGEGIKFYGNYRFNWRDVMDWNHNRTTFDPATGTLLTNWPIQNSGDEQEHNGLLGVAFPLGTGRMGLFFEYAGKRSDFSGRDNESYYGSDYFHRFSFESNLDNFVLRLLYGLPMGAFKLGGEIQLAYHREENETFINEDFSYLGPGLRGFYTNFPLGGDSPWINLHQFLFPYNSKYWEGILKGSLKGALGPAKIAFTVRGGVIFWGDNKYEAWADTPNGPGLIDASGDVKGWNIGSDFWLRYPLSKDLSLPFLLRISYQDKTRDASGWGMGSVFDLGVSGIGDYKNKEKNFLVEAGAGLDKELTKGTRIAAGVYYNYLQNKNSFKGFGVDTLTGDWGSIDYSKYPDQTEHRVILRIAGEKEVTPMFAMRMGLNFFYGWVKEDLKFNYADSSPDNYLDKISLDGSRWGIGASLGGTVKFERFSIEPFVGGGYQKLKLNGDGFETSTPCFIETDKLKKEWFFGGGLSVKF